LDGIKTEYNTASNVRVPIFRAFVREQLPCIQGILYAVYRIQLHCVSLGAHVSSTTY